MDSNSTSCCIEEVCSDAAAAAAAAADTKRSIDSRLQRVGSGGASAVLDPPDSTASPGSVESESGGRKLPSSRYKGVVPQPNGRWGAQIYEKHQRVWLGTFMDESDAARAYDVAAQRFRGRDAATNFKPLSDSTDNDDAAELALLNSRSKPEIVDMLRKHTYRDELQRSKRALGSSSAASCATANSVNNNNNNLNLGLAGAKVEQLFEKTVTPSDVGKLNRLVIPKQQAEKHFPLEIGSAEGCVLLNFEDASGKVWRFRYSYWNSSQSYVLTKGWSRFVKEKGLRAGDIVSFHRSKPQAGPESPRQLYIDWKPRAAATTSGQMVRLFGVNIFTAPPPLPSPPPPPLQAFKKQRLCSF